MKLNNIYDFVGCSFFSTVLVLSVCIIKDKDDMVKVLFTLINEKSTVVIFFARLTNICQKGGCVCYTFRY